MDSRSSAAPGAAFAKYLAVTRLVHEEFLKAIGAVKQAGGRRTSTASGVTPETVRRASVQLLSENFWNVWQSAGALPRLTAKVQVTSLT